MTILKAPAKINLFLKIKGKDSSGYHKIETVFLRTDKIYDLIKIEKAEKFSLICPSISERENTVYKAIKLLEKESGKKLNYKIEIKKNIPIKSGLGGGASDAAAVLVFLNSAESLKIPHKELIQIATKVGMDLPFFVSGFDIALGTNYGEKIEEIKVALPDALDFEIKDSGIQISTKDAYKKWDESDIQSTASLQEFLKALASKNPQKLIENLHNDFELILTSSKNLYDARHTQSVALLSGSGGAYAVFHVKDNYKLNNPKTKHLR